MDSWQAYKVVHDRIFKLEPKHIAQKIVGYVYMKGLPDHEMIRLAMAPDTLILNLIQNAKAVLNLASPPAISPPISPNMNLSPLSGPSIQFPAFSPASSGTFSAPIQRVPPPYWNSLPVHNKPMTCSDPIPEEYGLNDQFSVDDPLETMSLGPNDCYSHEAAFDNFGIRDCRNYLSFMDFPVKTCHYFSRGFCKNGSNCRYLHGEFFPDAYINDFGPNSFDVSAEDQAFSPGSLEKLEQDIAELLISQGGSPVSIAFLPMMYYERCGRTLQAEGYLTESQRHGKAGYSLTKVLERLKNSIKLISRPHGQHAVVLVEDAPKYVTDVHGDRNDPGPVVCGSRQIYLTFPAESTFTEEDVSNHFSSFGQVEDVRIPCQQKRMFGFVTFVSADTARLILSKGNPHYVCGARVLVKPYREKSKHVDRKYQEPYYYHSHPMDHDSEFQARLESSWLFRRQLMEEDKRALQLGTIRLSQLQLSGKHLTTQSCLGYSLDDLKFPKGHTKFQSTDRHNYCFDVVNHGSTRDKYPTTNNCSDQESAQGLDLPDSPFTAGSSISAVI
ncbi:zinc finger CCCH domain-containing protein 18-like isoform X2 [Primulina tabacum]|uniref:zinc finger CCCH domain-containing protein 18-like isoform X2 n=1 Tax=Primulina tabacum TaxID=48773 RepID=UPI003F5A9AF6